MKTFLFCVLLLFAGVLQGRAMLIPSYRLESWCLQADEIVLCDELEACVEITDHGMWKLERSVVRCRVERTFKGKLETGREFAPEYDPVFCRQVRFRLKGVADASGKISVSERPDQLPVGRVLLFLKKGKNPASYEVLTAKLIQEEGVYQYGQFESNPGPLVLAPQKPESVALAPGAKYGEKELIGDLQAALEKARDLTEPVPWLPSDFLQNPSGENSLSQMLNSRKK